MSSLFYTSTEFSLLNTSAVETCLTTNIQNNLTNNVFHKATDKEEMLVDMAIIDVITNFCNVYVFYLIHKIPYEN